ncbi:DUF6686 family protein [Winogradskyella ludwigii]|jgi:hypothetical protein|uniref:DUF6686 family protein n=1 Tax=Winogradskyella ludwigii TaxID=2686076 RepID=UPI0015CB0E78|nr:DUF6686 family protein [Winogradskyella ludwigii]
MNDIYKLYHNDFGIAFKWKNSPIKNTKKIQIVFGNTGLNLTNRQLTRLLKYITKILDNLELCEECKSDNSIKAILLETPSGMVSFAMSYIEINQMVDLLKGTIFQIEMDILLKKNKLN